MADFTKTITNSLRLLGCAPTPQWNAVTWNSFTWGLGRDVLVAVVHLISNSITHSSVIAEKDTVHLISNALSPTSDATNEILTDGSGYTYIYPSNSTNAGNRAVSNYTSGSAAGSTWTSGTAGSTTWS